MAERFAKIREAIIQYYGPRCQEWYSECECCRAWREFDELASQREVCQTLGKAIGYPRYCDDQKNFPGSTEADGVCTGEHVAETIAAEAADRICNLERERDEARKGYEALDRNWHTLHEMMGSSIRKALGMPDATVAEMVEKIGELIAETRN